MLQVLGVGVVDGAQEGGGVAAQGRRASSPPPSFDHAEPWHASAAGILRVR